jgi:hypothetical protein
MDYKGSYEDENYLSIFTTYIPWSQNTKWGLIGNFNWKKDIQCPKGTVYKDKQCSIKFNTKTKD